MGKRLALKQIRAGLDLSQQEIAAKIGVERSVYASVEQGARCGTIAFWSKAQAALNIPDSEMWGLMIDGVENIQN